MLNFVKYKYKKGYSNNGKYIVSSDAVFNVTPQSKGALDKVMSWSHSHGLLGGCRASFEKSGILFMFYRSRLFSKSFQGSYFIPYSKIQAYNEGQDHILRILFNRGSVFFPVFNVYNKQSPSYKVDIRCLKRLITMVGTDKISNGTYKDFKKHLNHLSNQVTVTQLKSTPTGRKKLAKIKKKKAKQAHKAKRHQQ